VEGERLHGGASLTTILGGAHITAPLEGGWGLGASARRSYADLFESDSTQYTQWPVFWDYLGRADHQGAGGESSLLVFGAGDAHGRYIADLDFADPLEAESATAYSTDRAFHAAIWSRRWGGERWQHEGRLGLLWDSVENLAGASTEQVQALNLTAQQRSLWRPSTDFQLSLGLEARPSHLSYDVQTDRAWVELGAEAPLLARGTPVEEQLLVMRGGAWVEPRWQLGDWRLQPGLRLQGESAAGTFAVDPRLLLRWSAAEDLSLRGAVGRYSMAPSPEDVAIPGGAPELGLARSEEAALGMDWAVAGRWEIALDGWGRRVSGAVDADPGQTPTAEDGWAAGAELTSRYRIRERFFAWTGLTVGRAERDGHPADHDQPWALSAVASWDFAPRWGAGLRYRYAAGLPETPIASGRYLGDSDSYEAVLGAENSERLPRYQKIDLHVERELLMRGWTMTLFAEGWFVPAPNNYLYRIHSYDYSESALVRGPTFLPLLGGRAEF
jgi:hypothetical protein